jgi:hypothetical protein
MLDWTGFFMNFGCTDNFQKANVDKLDYFYKFNNNCHSGWVDSKWHNNKQIQNINYFFDVSCENHSPPGQAPYDPVVLGKNVDTNVVTINENMLSSVNSLDISKMDYSEIFYVKNSDISQMDYFDVDDKSCVKSSNFSIYEQYIKSCNTNVDKNTVDCFSVPTYDAVEGCNLTGCGFQPHTYIQTYAGPSGGRVRDVEYLLDLGWIKLILWLQIWWKTTLQPLILWTVKN